MNVFSFSGNWYIFIFSTHEKKSNLIWVNCTFKAGIMHRYSASARLCDSYRDREGRVSFRQRGLCEWKSQHSSHRREMTHTSTHKAALQDQTVTRQRVVSSASYTRKKIPNSYVENPPTSCLPSRRVSARKQHLPPAAEPGGSRSWWRWLCGVIQSKNL